MTAHDIREASERMGKGVRETGDAIKASILCLAAVVGILGEIAAQLSELNEKMSDECTLPPDGWECSRNPGHKGPCAASLIIPE